MPTISLDVVPKSSSDVLTSPLAKHALHVFANNVVDFPVKPYINDYPAYSAEELSIARNWIENNPAYQINRTKKYSEKFAKSRSPNGLSWKLIIVVLIVLLLALFYKGFKLFI